MPLPNNVMVKFNDEFESKFDSGTIEVEVVDYGRGDRLKIARKKYTSNPKPMYQSIGTLTKQEVVDLMETMKEALKFMV